LPAVTQNDYFTPLKVKYFTLTSSLIMRSDVNLIWLLF